MLARHQLAVAFSGARHLSSAYAPLVGQVASSCATAGVAVLVGCAAGADSYVRHAVPGAQVFSVASGLWGSGRPAYARRSSAMVSALPRPHGILAVFVSSACPSGLCPSASARSCFCGMGSGSWASAALAAGLGARVVVFWCSSAPVALPSWPGGRWVMVSSGIFAGGWRFVRSQQKLI